MDKSCYVECRNINNNFKLSKRVLIHGLINRHILADLLVSCISSSNAGMKNRNAVNDSSDYALVLELMSSSNLSETLHLQV